MSVQLIPTGGLSLHDAPAKSSRNQNKSTIARSAILIRLNEQVVKGLQQCSRDGKALRLLAGKIPQLQYGGKSTDLVISTETYHHELYTSTGNAPDLSFRALVSQSAEVKTGAKHADTTAGADEALANLKNSLASFAQDKEAKKATITSGLIANSKNNKSLPASRRLPASSQSTSRFSSPSASNATNQKLAPTSASHEPQEAAKAKAMDRVLLHLLAIKPLTDREIMAITHIPMSKCLERLYRIADLPCGSQEWELKSKSYKDLDVWAFKYKTESDRQKAINNAVRNFDRLRLSKEDKLWQMLLPEDERGKGKILSRLHSGVVAQASRERASSQLSARSPIPGGEITAEAKSSDVDAKPSTSTPRMGALDMKKKLNQAKKNREAEEAKQKKRQEKEKEAAASDRESKPRAKAVVQTKKLPSKVKSAETVNSSDDEDDTSVRDKDSVLGRSTAKDTMKTKTTTSPEKLAVDRKASSKSPLSTDRLSSRQPNGNKSAATERIDALPSGRSNESKTLKKPESAPSSSQSIAAPRAKTTTPSTTPSGRSEKHQPAPSSKHPQLSPRKPDNRPRVPSPLGAAKPRQAPDTSSLRKERSPAPPVRPLKTVETLVKTGRPSTPVQGLKDAAAAKKRPLSESGDEAGRPSKSAKTSVSGTVTKPLAKQTAQKPNDDSQTVKNGDLGLKRKANDISSGIHDHNVGPQAKHRRTDSTSTHSAKYSSGSSNSGSQTTTAQTSVASPVWERSPSNVSSSSEGAVLSWEKALAEAEAFQTQYYPKYIELYERLSALPQSEIKVEDRKKLMQMHERLSQMKKDIHMASR